jgi:hypothetical protein
MSDQMTIIEHLEKALAIARAGAMSSDDKLMYLTLHELSDPIHCSIVARFLHKRTNSVTRKLESAGLPIAKVGRFKFCRKADAGAIWPNIKKKLENI